MKISSGRVEDGKIVVNDGLFAEGSTVTVLGSDSEDDFELSAEEESSLIASMQQIDNGEVVDGHAFLRELRSRG